MQINDNRRQNSQLTYIQQQGMMWWYMPVYYAMLPPITLFNQNAYWFWGNYWSNFNNTDVPFIGYKNIIDKLNQDIKIDSKNQEKSLHSMQGTCFNMKDQFLDSRNSQPYACYVDVDNLTPSNTKLEINEENKEKPQIN